jgi:cyclopropane fatty-acyl-phospholipid synthase-like methyltransferase
VRNRASASVKLLLEPLVGKESSGHTQSSKKTSLQFRYSLKRERDGSVMQLKATHYDVQELYTAKADAYRSFSSTFHYGEGLRAVFVASGLLRPSLRVLDAGCGFGTTTFAIVEALRKRNFSYQTIDAFDLTPAMLARFRANLDANPIADVHLRQADVLTLEELPSSWNDYDLILSTSMLEHLPKEELPSALSALRSRLAQNGALLAVITRKNLTTKFLIEWWWHARRYSRRDLQGAFAAAGFRNVRFNQFPFRYCWLNTANYAVVAKVEGEINSRAG